jgi:hypothetical protein
MQLYALYLRVADRAATLAVVKSVGNAIVTVLRSKRLLRKAVSDEQLEGRWSIALKNSNLKPSKLPKISLW